MKGLIGMTVNFKLLGKRIREVRKQQGISQAYLAEEADVSATYISRIETAKKQVSLKVLLSIANALEVTVDELLTGNQIYDMVQYQTDIDVILADCTSFEKIILIEAIRSSKGILRENTHIFFPER